MRTIDVVLTDRPRGVWKEWLAALFARGMKIRLISPKELEAAMERSLADAVLFDGMLPNLAREVAQLQRCRSDLQVLVATEIDSFSIFYEVMLLDDAIYVSGPLDGSAFADGVARILGEREFSVEFF